jgi:hypothetical protein
MEYKKKYEYINLRKNTQQEKNLMNDMMSLICPSSRPECQTYSITKLKNNTTTINVTFFYKGIIDCQIKYNFIDDSYRVKRYLNVNESSSLEYLNHHNTIKEQLKILIQILESYYY